MSQTSSVRLCSGKRGRSARDSGRGLMSLHFLAATKKEGLTRGSELTVSLRSTGEDVRGGLTSKGSRLKLSF